MGNENIKINEETMEPAIEAIEAVADGGSGVDYGKVLLTTGGLALAAVAVVGLVKLGMKLWDDHKDKTETQQPAEHNFVVPSDEEIAEVTK